MRLSRSEATCCIKRESEMPKTLHQNPGEWSSVTLSSSAASLYGHHDTISNSPRFLSSSTILPMRSLLASMVLFVGRSAATQTFTPECTLPPPGTNYVSGPNTRSTLSILWNCLSIVVLCTWTIQHLNVPGLRPEPKHYGQKLWWQMVDATTKLKWMILTILFPEYLVGKALGDWLAVRSMRRFGWGTVEAYMANMGYFVLDVGDIPEGPFSEADERAQEFFRNARPQKSTTLLINYSRLKGRYWALNAIQFREAIQIGMTDGPSIPSSQLEKLDKGGALVKALALVQVGYLVAQLIARKAAGLPSSQPEIATLAFAVSSGMTYVLYWNKPQGIETTHIVKVKPRDFANFGLAAVVRKTDDILDGSYQWLWRPTDRNASDWNDREKSLDWLRNIIAEHGPSYLWFWLRSSVASNSGAGPVPIPNDASHVLPSHFATASPLSDLLGGHEETGMLAVGSVLGGIIFGGIHCLAWNFQFPTPTELAIWRVCSVLTTCLPLVAVVPIAIWVRKHSWMTNMRVSGGRGVLGPLMVVGFILPYILARLVLIVEVFRTLCYLPPEAYIETWSGSLPHWA